MIWYFKKSLKPFIKVKIEQYDQVSTNFKEMMQIVVNVEAKTGLQSNAIVQDADSHCLKGYYSSNNTDSKV